MIRATRCRRQGFSLIETLAALAIFSVAVVGLIQGIAMMLHSWRLAEDQNRALMLSESLMEQALSKGEPEVDSDSGQFDPPNQRFRWEWSIEQSDIESLYRVQSRVFWTSGGQERDATLTTFRAVRSLPLQVYNPESTGEGGGGSGR